MIPLTVVWKNGVEIGESTTLTLFVLWSSRVQLLNVVLRGDPLDSGCRVGACPDR